MKKEILDFIRETYELRHIERKTQDIAPHIKMEMDRVEHEFLMKVDKYLTELEQIKKGKP